MRIPWLRVIDTAIDIADIAREATGGRAEPEPEEMQLEATPRGGAGLEQRLAGVVVAALKEAFDRDARRLDFERQQLAAERERAERALRLELQRQAGDREIGRLRLLGGVALTAWIGTLVLAPRLVGGIGARVSLGFGWLLLLGAIAASFVAQSRTAAAVDALAVRGEARAGEIGSGVSGVFALWLTIGGFVLVGLAALLA